MLSVWVALGVLAVSLSAQAQERFAFVIGANAGWSNDRPLRHAERDAEHMRDVLVELGGFTADHVQLLLDPDAAQVKAALNALNASIREANAQALFFLYYSGHADEQHLHLRGGALSHGELLSLLRGSAGPLRLGVMDVCRSGSILATEGNGRRSSFAMKVVDELEESGLAVLTASGADELSQGQRALGGSAFTRHLASGLRGAADRDADEQVTFSEAYEYALGHTQADTGSPESQGPKLSGEGTRVLTWLTHGSSRLVLPRGAGERYLVVDQYEWKWVAEVRAQPEREVVLALPPGEYRLKRVGEHQLEVASVRLKPGTEVAVSGLSFEPRPLSAGLLNGRPDRRHPVEVRAWRQSEALRLLAASEARAALRLFDRILEEVPDDAAAARGRGRALVRLAEAYARARDTARERKALRAALVSDPSLARDPDFHRQHRRLTEVEAAGYHDIHVSAHAAADNIETDPRVERSWGLGFEVLSTRGLLGISVILILKERFFPYLTLDLTGGLDAGLRFAPVRARWSPFIGFGAHVTTKQLGVNFKPVRHFYEDVPWELLLGRNVHLEVGIQYVSEIGLATELGYGLVLPFRDRILGVGFMPVLAGQVFF